MHDRLTEIGAPVTTPLQLTPIEAPPSSPLRRETYFVSKERGTLAGREEEVDSSDGKRLPKSLFLKSIFCDLGIVAAQFVGLHSVEAAFNPLFLRNINTANCD